jgi:hypothetical protein
MLSFLAAHGYDPGPVQRPIASGGAAGLLGTVPASAVLWTFGSLHVEAEILGLAIWQTLGAGALAMTLFGALYGALFRRAANDKRGGWLFGMSYAFLLWTGGAVMLLPIFIDGRAPAGVAAIGVFLSLLAWGACTGAAFPHVQRRLSARLDTARSSETLGPNAARSVSGG